MSPDVGTENIDLNTDRGTRSAVESAVATHAPGGLDVDSVVNSVREHHSREIKKRNDASTPADRADRLRIRNAVKEAKDKAAAPPQKPVNGAEAPIGPPVTWSKDAKAQWESLPHEARMAALREQKAYADTVQPIVQRYTEMEQAIAPHRDIIPKHISASLMRGTIEITRSRLPVRPDHLLAADIARLTRRPPWLCSSIEAQKAAQIAATLETFSRDKPFFQEVRRSMGLILSARGEEYLRKDGETDLDKLYADACKIEGYSNNKNSKRGAAVSPSGRSPSAALVTSERGKGIRASIKAAIQESRGRM